MRRQRIWPGPAALAAALWFAATAAQAAPAPTAPSVTTGSATALTPRTATIAGTVSSNGAATSYSFEYGSSTSYGSQTRVRHAGRSAANVAVSANLAGLAPGTLYHYALVATNAVGSTTGSDQTFTTPVPPAPSVSTGPATAVTAGSAILGGTVDPNGGPTTFFFQYGATSSYGAQTPTRSAGTGTADLSVAASLHGLSSGTIYHYRVVATNGAGTTDGADQTFMTTAAPPPTVVTSSATSVAQRTATLTGTVTPNGAATTYEFQYGTTTSYGSQTPARYAGAGLTGVPVSARVSGLSPGQSYHYRLVATSSSGTVNGSDQSFTTGPAKTHVSGTYRLPGVSNDTPQAP